MNVKVESRHFIRNLSVFNLKCDIVDKDKFLFHQKNKQAKIRRQFNTSVMAEESCKHKRTEKK